jgi:hypothetical protein
MGSSRGEWAMALLEVEIVRWANDAMDHYRSEYEKRYGVQPIMQNHAFQAGQTTLKDLVRSVGIERVKKMISQYLKNDGDNGWYKKMGHTLHCFQKNVEQINAQTKEAPKERVGVKMRIRTACSNEDCKKWFEKEMFVRDFSETIHNELCNECKAAGKNATPAKKKEFYF